MDECPERLSPRCLTCAHFFMAGHFSFYRITVGTWTAVVACRLRRRAVLNQAVAAPRLGPTGVHPARLRAPLAVDVVVIGPNPNYSAKKRLAIEHDYQMINGETKLRTRKAQLYYLKRRLNLNASHDETIDDAQQIIMLRIEDPLVSTELNIHE